MVTCPWCGSSYTTFQTNCSNCGGPLPPVVERTAPSAAPVNETPPAPPPPPRKIADSFVFRLVWKDSQFFGFFGLFCIGAVLMVLSFFNLHSFDAFIGIGAVIAFGSAALIFWRYLRARQIMQVLRSGEATLGQILRVEQENTPQGKPYSSWIIEYKCIAKGKPIKGRLRINHPPAKRLQAGQKVWVLYLPNKPEQTALYPHP